MSSGIYRLSIGDKVYIGSAQRELAEKGGI
jgi:hypothetical protein